jgi:hypothetical protein
MSKEEKEHDDVISANDRELGNVLIRAGYLRGLAERWTGEDRVFLLRASRSLRAYAESLAPTQRGVNR